MVASAKAETKSPNPTSMELAGDREIVIRRTFNGPARVVFEAFTRPEHVRRWWAPRKLGVALTSVDADVRVEGKYRYVMKNPDGSEVAFSGEYTEITPPTRLVYTQRLEPFPDAVVVTATFEERDGRTQFTSREVYPSAEIRTMALESGMETGMRETMDQLDELVATLR